MESAFCRELAVAGILDEISNAEDGEAIGRYVTNAGAVGGGKVTKKAVLFVVYQTGRDGPQNGFRVALVKEGVPVESAIQQLKGEVVQNAAEYVVVRKI